MKYAFIQQQQQQQQPVSLLCRVLEVSVAGYYAWRTRPPSARRQQNEQLSQQIHRVFEASGYRYGSPRVFHELRAAGVVASRKRVARLMKVTGLRAKRGRRRARTTDANHTDPIAPNVLARQFSPDSIPARNRVWAGEIT